MALMSASVLLLAVATARGEDPTHSPFVPAAPGGRPACARESATFCETVPKYPKDLIQRLLRNKISNFQDFFNDESSGLEEPPEHILHQEMPFFLPPRPSKARWVRSVVETTVPNAVSDKSGRQCLAVTKTITPLVGMTVGGEWRYLVQEKDSGVKVQVQVCDYKHGDNCKDKCVQLYKPVTLRSLSVEGEIREASFWMPNSCRCPTDILPIK